MRLSPTPAGGRIADSRSAILSLLKDGSKGLLEDKARLLALVAVSGDPHVNNKASAEEFEEAFKQGWRSGRRAVVAGCIVHVYFFTSSYLLFSFHSCTHIHIHFPHQCTHSTTRK